MKGRKGEEGASQLGRGSKGKRQDNFDFENTTPSFMALVVRGDNTKKKKERETPGSMNDASNRNDVCNVPSRSVVFYILTQNNRFTKSDNFVNSAIIVVLFRYRSNDPVS